MSTPYSDYPQRHLYKNHAAGNGYGFDPGTFILPVACAEPTDPDQLKKFVPFVEVQAYCPMMTRTVPFDTVKDGGPPKVQKPDSTGAFRFMGGGLFVHSPRQNANGWTYIWEVEGEYTYAVAAPVSAELQNGLVLGSLPFPTFNQQALTQAYGQTQVPEVGSISQSGADVKAGYGEALTISFTADYYVYRSISLYPGQFFTDNLLNGDTQSRDLPTGVPPPPIIFSGGGDFGDLNPPG